jgi:anti-sigma regulatory factor (Ser/Thr protein kinase)
MERAHPFRHEAFFHAGDDEFIAGALPFIREAVDAGEPILVAVSARKVARLRRELGPASERVRFADMATLGLNPARIIPAWHDFVSEHRDVSDRIRGIGEPIWPGRSDAELSECYRHECLLNVAFAEADGFTLLCPYDTATLDPEVVEAARHSHPVVAEHGARVASDRYREAEFLEPFAAHLSRPPAQSLEVAFSEQDLPRVRGCLRSFADGAGLSQERQDDLVLAVHELATNSVRHAGGNGALRLWRDGGSVVCEVADRGRIDAPMVGRFRPAAGQIGGYGVWLANQLCELVQVRSFDSGNVVRVHMHAG